VGTKHQETEYCKNATWRKKNHEETKAQDMMIVPSFYIEGRLIKRVSKFKYLGRILTEEDSDNATVERNLQKARKSWGMVATVLARRETSAHKMAYFYQAIVQAVLLYGSETWVVTKDQLQKLNTFHHWCARFITGRFIHPGKDGIWIYPSSQEALKQAGLTTINEYITRRRNTVFKSYISMREVLQVCMKSENVALGASKKCWWDQVEVENQICPDT
jgi:hypothetical protein